VIGTKHLLAALFLLAWPALADLTVSQRVHEFQNLAATYAVRYAPAEWKHQLTGFDIYDLRPWLDRIRALKDDVEFFEVCTEYFASLDDIHSSFVTPSSYSAVMGFTVDVFDGKVLIDAIQRGTLKKSCSIDSVAVEEQMARFTQRMRRAESIHHSALRCGHAHVAQPVAHTACGGNRR
jgi:hypothetical protein